MPKSVTDVVPCCNVTNKLGGKYGEPTSVCVLHVTSKLQGAVLLAGLAMHSPSASMEPGGPSHVRNNCES